MYRWENIAAQASETTLKSGLHPLVENILWARGVRDHASLQAFLYPDYGNEHDPFLFSDMAMAVKRLELARERKEKVLIHGDYDADGITSAALLFLALTQFGLRPQVYIPTRAEGYGLQKDSLAMAAENGISLVITVDCGVQAVEEAKLAHSLGLDLIITDHHTPAAELPVVLALINPRLPHCTYPFKGLAGVGVAYKLACALLGEEARAYLDYVAVGTVADVAPLVGENRLYVKKGLEALASPRLCFQALMEVAAVKPASVTAGSIGFMLAPRLNAAGRLEDAVLPLQLLLTQDMAKAQALARELDDFNRARQRLEAQILAEALAMVEANSPALVLYAPHWSPGVVGVVASRLVERFHRPAILLCQDEEGALRGSGRSIPGFDLIAALRRCEHLLLRCGGHPMAAGLSLSLAEWEAFRAAFLALAGEIPPHYFIPKLTVQAEISPEDVSERLIADIALLAPFGVGNSQPIFASQPIVVADKRRVGKESQHLRLLLANSRGGNTAAVMFNQAARYDELVVGERVRVAFRPSLDEYQGKAQVSLHLQDFAVGKEWWLVDLPYMADYRFARLSAATQGAFFVPAHLFVPLILKVQGGEVSLQPALNLDDLDTAYVVTPRWRREPELPPGSKTYAADSDLVYNGNMSQQVLVPKRPSLMLYYRYLATRSSFSVGDFARAHSLPLAAAHSVCAAALQIFAELSLLTYEHYLGQVTLTHCPVVGTKQELGQSPTFNALQAWEKEALL
ncbi:MAG: single-stranded-DNA-specific exonuclease RecJ [Firmicutes bacterium]|nr:single-stranded-DNA-specific exonuclease RecJ [Dethiobacter sp.]MBS3889233.1 single-stranded-DNA-specific exonuclease RecJ [Bacillota bacterium]MBS4053729.1 single-stranded-DNA-specific exonuclease RecJ [Thermaerobacter sp.]